LKITAKSRVKANTNIARFLLSPVEQEGAWAKASPLESIVNCKSDLIRKGWLAHLGS
jgi:hypothetical protein